LRHDFTYLLPEEIHGGVLMTLRYGKSCAQPAG
jgi:hypothetical protein